jgi:hypothetical protein
MSVESALAARTDLNPYRAGKRSLFALQLALRLEDVHSIASSVLTDGPDDKSCDLIYVDRDAGRIVMVQGYEADNPSRVAAPQGKAASLHQAASWMFSQDLGHLPQRLRAGAVEVHDALRDGAIQQIEIWFVHNLPESENVRSELAAIASSARRIIEHRYPDVALDSVIAEEVGRETLEDWYQGSQTPILVTDDFDLAIDGYFEEDGDNWSAICTSVEATWLHDQFARFGERVFSANVRGYLGSTRSQKNINNGIKDTAQRAPRKLWAFNNGVTALVHSYESRDGRTLSISGLAIVNGAQTTGAIGSVDRAAVEGGRVLARFIRCGDVETVRSIIRYNNRQNPTEAADFRSNDRVQTRLVKEFADLGVIGYSGGRRGGAEDVIRRPAENQVPATVAAQALAAFHREPGVAYHEKGQIWESNEIYDKFFGEKTSARHILLCYSLLRAVEQARQELISKPEEERTASENRLVAFFRQRGSNFLLAAAVADCVEIFLDRQVADRFRLQFRRTLGLPQAIAEWRKILVPALALAPQALGSMLEREGSLRQRESVNDALATFRALFDATKDANEPRYAAFRSTITTDD